MLCCALTTGRCNACQHIFVNQKKLEFYFLWLCFTWLKMRIAHGKEDFVRINQSIRHLNYPNLSLFSETKMSIMADAELGVGSHPFYTSPDLFGKLKKVPSFGRVTWSCLSMSLISYLKYGFQSIQEKKTFSLQGFSIICCRWNIYWGMFVPGNLLCPEKCLVAHLHGDC